MNGSILALFVLYILPVVLFFVVLYFVIKAAVRNGIRETRRDTVPREADPGPSAQTGLRKCDQCGYTHFISDIACPKCGHTQQ